MARLEVIQFPARSDNFGVLLHDPDSGLTAAIDAPDADPIQRILSERGWALDHIFVTHHHQDHIEGIPALKAAHGCTVTGPAASAAKTGLYERTTGEGEPLSWAGRDIRVLATPGHTLDHLSFWMPAEELAFVGDTIFSLGCGRVIEGTHDMMWQSIAKLRDLPDETRLYCGHEYTLANARFALTIEPDNADLAERAREVERLRAAGEPTLPTTLGLERRTNPFLRPDEPGVAEAVGLAGAPASAVFAEIRKRKDRF